MKKSRRYVSLLAAAQLAAACSPDQSVPTDARERSMNAATATAPSQSVREEAEHLVVAFGDSLYAGYGVGSDESFPSVLERKLDEAGGSVQVVNAGVSGDTTAAGKARLAFAIDGLGRKPDLVIVGLGGNDALRGIDPAQTRSNLEAILEELERRDIPVMLTGMMAPRNLGPDYVARFDAIFPELARDHDAVLDPFFLEGVIGNPDLMLADGIHPNAAGIERMAERVAPLVADRLARD